MWIRPASLENSHLTYNSVDTLTVSEILRLVNDKLVVLNQAAKEHLIQFILNNATHDLQISFRDVIITKAHKKEEGWGWKLEEEKRRWNDVLHSRQVAAQVEAELDEVWDVSKFLQLPDEARVKECYQQFYNATSNEAI